jgi:hypothetical protein
VKESDIMWEGVEAWVGRERKAYTVFVHEGSTHSVSDSSYAKDEDGLSIAIARAKYLDKKLTSKKKNPKFLDTGIKGQYHIDLMKMFEKEFTGYRRDKEPKDLWPKGRIYQDGKLNELFLAYRRGASYGLVVGRADAEDYLDKTAPQDR